MHQVFDNDQNIAHFTSRSSVLSCQSPYIRPAESNGQRHFAFAANTAVKDWIASADKTRLKFFFYDVVMNDVA